MRRIINLLASCAIFALPQVNGLASETNGSSPLEPPSQEPVDGVPKPTLKQLIERQSQPGAKARSSISPENFAKLEILYERQLYPNISSYLLQYKDDKGGQDWMLAKASQGSVPMMWMLADQYASVQTIDLAVKWGYAALLGTMQERALCLDSDVEYAAGKISEEHKRIMFLDRSNPFMTKEAKIFAMDALSKAPRYPHPTPWLCKPYSSPERLKKENSLYSYDEPYFTHLRTKARNAIRTKYQIAQPLEPLPALPLPAKP